MNTSEQTILINYLNAGGAVYFEGVNIGEDHNQMDLWNYTGAEYLGQGQLHTGMNDLVGQAGTFVEGKTLEYQINTYADIHNNRFGAGPAEILLRSNDNHGRVVSYSNDTYRTITSSMMIGAVIDGDGLNTKLNMMKLYISYLINNQEADIYMNQDGVDFGIITPGDEASQHIMIQNVGINPLEISNIAVSNSDFQINNNENITLEFGQSTTIQVDFVNNQSGEYQAEISMNTNDPDQPTINIPVTVDNFTFPSIEFPQEVIGDSEDGNGTVSFELNNIGQQDLSYWIQILPNDRPDNYGYNWQDSNTSDLEFVWNDLSTMGSHVNFISTDADLDIPLPFSFPFYGDLKTQVKVSSNGYLTFGSDGVDYSNDEIPSPINPNDLIAVFWDDLNGSNGQLHYYHDVVEGSFTIQYDGMTFFNGSGDLNFQVKLLNNGDIYYYYNNMEGNLYSSTIGIENANATDGLEIAYNETYLESYMAVKISYNVDWANLDYWHGLVTENNPMTHTIELATGNLPTGDYSATIRVNSNSAENSVIDIPLTVNVNTTPNSDGEVELANNQLLQNYPNPFNPETNIQFTLGKSGYVELAVYDLRGRKVKTLVNENRDAGNHNIVWDGTNNQQRSVASGVYFYKIRSGKYSRTKKMILMK